MIDIETLNFEKGNGLIPAIIQNDKTLEVLMLGYVSKDSLLKTQRDGRVCFYSRSRNELWTKGETSGNFLNVVSIGEDCDSDALLIRVNPEGPTCHTGSKSCFGELSDNGMEWLPLLEDVIESRKTESPENSYTAKLFARGLSRMAQKVGEEGLETALAAVTDDENFIGEASDLIFHLLVLLNAKGYNLSDVSKYLRTRHK